MRCVHNTNTHVSEHKDSQFTWLEGQTVVLFQPFVICVFLHLGLRWWVACDVKQRLGWEGLRLIGTIVGLVTTPIAA